MILMLKLGHKRAWDPHNDFFFDFVKSRIHQNKQAARDYFQLTTNVTRLWIILWTALRKFFTLRHELRSSRYVWCTFRFGSAHLLAGGAATAGSAPQLVVADLSVRDLLLPHATSLLSAPPGGEPRSCLVLIHVVSSCPGYILQLANISFQ
jgi:hypothetical protein